MKKLLLIILITTLATTIWSAPRTFIFKAQPIVGQVLNLSTEAHPINPSMAMGGELAIELPSWNEYPWQEYLGHPTIGVGLVGINLGNNKVLGQAFAAYPYILIHCVKARHFHLNLKFGAGLSLLTKTYNMTNNNPNMFYTSEANVAISSILNAFINTGINLNFPINRVWAIHADIGHMHMSNGTIIQPNAGINLAYASIGANYTINPRAPRRYYSRYTMPYRWSANFTASGGYRELHYRDARGYAVGSIHAGVTYNIASWYAIGVGVDAFYDGVFNRQGTIEGMSAEDIKKQQQHTLYQRYLITDDKFTNKLRAGIAINNEFNIGKFTTLIDLGVYLYDPIKLAYKYTDENGIVRKHTSRPMFYKYDHEKEDGWNYFKLGIRYRIIDNLYIQASLKSHLFKAEMLEWGIGYKIPWAYKYRNEHRRNKYNKIKIYHHRR